MNIIFLGLNRKHGIKIRRKLFCTIHILTQLIFSFRYYPQNFYQVSKTLEAILLYLYEEI